MSEKTKTLAARMCAIMADAEGIEKKGYNAFHKYKYVREADVSEWVRGQLAKNGVFCFPSTEEVIEREHVNNSGKKSNFIRVKIRYTFVNADAPDDKFEITSYGDGIDGEDKGIYKALTGCHKYMLLRTFNLGAEDDPEQEGKAAPATAPRRPAAPAPVAYQGKNGSAVADDDEPPPYEPEFYPEDGASVSSAAGPVFLNVPFPDKERAKSMGARWDKEAKQWFVPEGKDPAPFSEWYL